MKYCSLDGCENKHYARTYCRSHYYQARRGSEVRIIHKYRHAKHRKLGITSDQYEERIAKQNNLCAVCGYPETKTINGRLVPLSVDHDHKTGEIRGLLCDHCNNGLGRFQDDVKRLRRAIDYLEGKS